METPTSKSQIRALAIAGLPSAQSYEGANEALENAGLRGDGLPAGKTWREAAKIESSALLIAIALDPTGFEDTSIDRY